MVLQQDATPASTDSAATDVRLITASHRDLEKMITNEQFREDLYYRLNVVSLAVPPLRERDNDVRLLAEAILQKTLQRLSKPVRKFSTEALKAMRAYPWPGNVRELENAIERAVILSEATELTSELLAIDTNPVPTVEQSTPQPDLTMEDYFVSFVTARQDQLTETELAERLGISRKSLWERRQRLNIPRKKTRNRRPRRNVS
jgi:DNA-binding NtrC family response regulator